MAPHRGGLRMAVASTAALAKDLYAECATVLTDHPGVHELLRRLTEEKGRDALRLEALVHSQGSVGGDPQVAERICRECEGLSDEIQGLRAELIYAAGAHAAFGLLGRLARIEARLEAIHVEKNVSSADPEIGALFATLVQHDARHRALVEGAWAEVRPAPRAR